jgi:cyclopropane fatty-acyl-phospholipid synthase-like methyltransferase
MHWREYEHIFDQAGVTPGKRHLDIACGSGLAIQLASERGAMASGIDASERLIAIARARTPSADIRLGDMFHLPHLTTTALTSRQAAGGSGDASSRV